MEHDYKGYVIKTFTRSVELYKLGQLERIGYFPSLDAAMRWVDRLVSKEDPWSPEYKMDLPNGGLPPGL